MKQKLKKILLVDDDEDVRSLVQLALEVVGSFTVQICSSGSEALFVAEAFEPDLILLDVMMPDMDGPTTLQEMRKLPILAKKPVFFLTAKSSTADMAALRKMGAADVIAKPFEPMTLAATIEDMWNRI